MYRYKLAALGRQRRVAHEGTTSTLSNILLHLVRKIVACGNTRSQTQQSIALRNTQCLGISLLKLTPKYVSPCLSFAPPIDLHIFLARCHTIPEVSSQKQPKQSCLGHRHQCDQTGQTKSCHTGPPCVADFLYYLQLCKGFQIWR